MNGAEFIKKIRKAAKAKGLEIRIEQHRGKGSHVTLYIGTKFTVMKDRKKEIGTGLRDAMIKQLGFTKEDIK
jgi:mRNA interferase HicA